MDQLQLAFVAPVAAPLYCSFPPAALPPRRSNGAESPEGRRTAVLVLKARPTPAQYPRKPGVPGKKPL